MSRTSLLAGFCIIASAGYGVAAPAPKESLPVRALVLAGAPTREYQFLRTLLFREQDKKRFEVRIFLQNGAGLLTEERDLLTRFPERLEATGDKYAALGTYDVLVAFDPDWTKLSAEQRLLVAAWVKKGGGMIVVAGPLHTYPLVRRADQEALKMIAELYPVVLDDPRLNERDAQKPWRLHFGKATQDLPFLKLNPDGAGPLAGWEQFFTGARTYEDGRDKPLQHGFYGLYPVKSVKAGAKVVATFGDPAAAISKTQEQPYMVVWARDKGQVFYLSSGEIWRLRQVRDSYHERFWTELIRFVSKGSGAVKNDG